MGADSTTPFTIEAQPATDIWKKPPSTNVFNAPISRTTTGPLTKFRSARVTFWADWKERYDQGGLLLVPRRRSSAAPSAASPPAQWIKAGVELYQGAPQLSTVATDRWSDWSVSPLDTSNTSNGSSDSVTIEIAREGGEEEDDGGGDKSAWVYRLVLDEATGEVRTRVPLREICWIFADEHEHEHQGGGDGEGEGEGEWVLDVSPLVARPEKKADALLRVRFTEFKVEWAA